MRDVARKHKVATQMGNQGHSFDSTRRVVELVRAGVIGPVRQVHVWTERPIWPQALSRPTETLPVPSAVNWDLWLGPAPQRPYHPAYLPFNWRGWWDFGTGALGDMACHCWDTAYWALDLGVPETVEAQSEGGNAETYPKWSIIDYQFPARGSRPPVKLTWYDGGKLPTTQVGKELPKNGSLIIGDKGTIFLRDWNADKFQILPEEKFKDYPQPPQTIARSPGHYKEWIAACKGGPPAMSNFDYAAPLTEAVLLGNVAIRLGRKIEWDTRNMRVKGAPEADRLIRPEYRAGWSI
jgi:predicted dehydrogenase